MSTPHFTSANRRWGWLGHHRKGPKDTAFRRLADATCLLHCSEYESASKYKRTVVWVGLEFSNGVGEPSYTTPPRDSSPFSTSNVEQENGPQAPPLGSPPLPPHQIQLGSKKKISCSWPAEWTRLNNSPKTMNSPLSLEVWLMEVSSHSFILSFNMHYLS
jgi:hypothetical protein